MSAQRSYLETVPRQVGGRLPPGLTQTVASEHIGRLQTETGRETQQNS